jgi:AcrR family transcriptional regulator
VTTHLSAGERRRQFLDAAGVLFLRDGLAGVTMIAVAHEAGVSRRLLYDHFPDLGSLLREYFWTTLSQQLPPAESPDKMRVSTPPDAIRETFGEVLLLGPEQRALIELVRARPQNPDLVLIRQAVDANLLGRWRRFPEFAALSDAQVLVMGRVMLGAVLELVDAVHAGTLERLAAVEAAVGVGTVIAESLRGESPRTQNCT